MQQDLASALEAALPTLPAKDQSFANSLLSGFRKYGRFTDRQLPYVEKLVKPAKSAAEPVDLSKLNAMFERAAEHLKRPRVRFLINDTELMIRPADATGSNPGYLYVLANGAYQGKIDPYGRFSTSREALPAIVDKVRAFAANPAGIAAAYGQETGTCCFCARDLTDARSVEVGYGKICASRFGLPWGI